MPSRSKPRRLSNSHAVRWPSTAVLRWLRDRVEAGGGDPSDVPEMPFQMLQRPAVEKLTGLSRTSLYRMMSAGEFPKATSVDRASVRAA
jgi:predicted DNA-binding transcriptional regulator AlpA